MRHRSGVLVVGYALSAFWACGALALGVVSAQAQSRPYAATFGGERNSQSSGQTLGTTISFAEAYDADILARNTTPSSVARPQRGGFYTELSDDTQYSLRRRRGQLNVDFGTNLRYFPEFNDVQAVGHYLTARTIFDVGSRSSVSASQSISYMPAYLPGFSSTAAPVAGAASAAVPNYAFTNRQSYTSATNLLFNRRFGRHSTFDFQSGYRQTRYTGSLSGRGDLTSYDAGFRYGHSLGRDVVLRLGYAYREAQYSSGRTPHQHDIGLGVDYNRPLSRTRKTWLTFSFGSTVLDAPPPLQTTGAMVRQLRAFGNATLTHQFGRTWSARAIYRRGAQFVEELSGPVFSDTLTFATDGFFSRRTEWTSSAVYSSGDVTGQSNSAYRNYAGNARLRYAVTRSLAAFVEYFYYYYEFQPGAQGIAVSSRVNRNGARVGIATWIPIFGK